MVVVTYKINGHVYVIVIEYQVKISHQDVKKKNGYQIIYGSRKYKLMIKLALCTNI